MNLTLKEINIGSSSEQGSEFEMINHFLNSSISASCRIDKHILIGYIIYSVSILDN